LSALVKSSLSYATWRFSINIEQQRVASPAQMRNNKEFSPIRMSYGTKSKDFQTGRAWNP
jgi:hypothetical protein